MWQAVQNKRRIIGLGLSALAVVFAFGTAVLQPQGADAQDITPDALRALQQHATGNDDDATGAKPTIQTYQPVAQQGVAPKSALEDMYSVRAGRPLAQVGYESLGLPASVSIVQSGAVQDSYVLGIGDEVVVELRGQENSSFRQRVDRDGRIVLPKLNPIPAAGHTFGDFRATLESEVNRAYVQTKVFASLGEAHQVSVMVTGNVRTPGMRIVSAFASPLDAILLSGGISKIGSLRNVQLIRSGTVRTIDLYALILNGTPVRMGTLQDGDRIYVAPLGATVAIAGTVPRPGIYELPVGATSTSALSLIKLAGGPLISGAYDISKIMLDRDGTTRLIPTPKNSVVHSGEVVFVDPGRSADIDRVAVAGAVQLPGTHPLSSTSSTADLFHGINDLLPNAYTPFALITRRNATSNALSLLTFSVIGALKHTGTTPLQSNDSVYIFTVEELRALTRIVTKDVNSPYRPDGAGDQNNLGAANPARTAAAVIGAVAAGPIAAGQGAIVPPGAAGAATTPAGAAGAYVDPRYQAAVRGASTEGAAFASAQSLIHTEAGVAATPAAMAPPETDDQIADRISATLGVPREMLEHTIGDHLIWVLDQVHVPGVYATADGVTIQEIINAAGGSLEQADLSSVEVTSTEFDRLAGVSHTTRNSYSGRDVSFNTVVVRPLDVIRLRQVYADRTGETVTVAGQVRYPGILDITRDERLSSVLQRAGGLTEVAYPYGAIFTRRSAAIHEQEGNDRSARELQSQLVQLAASPAANSNGPNASLTFIQDLVQQVRNAPALGRVTVTADPVVLASRPDLDVILEPGDAVYIPKRPSSVTVSGEVLNPGSFQFRADIGFEDYIRLAGGPTQAAYESRSFVVLPDGSATPIEDSWISFQGGGHIPPGSTIIVPRDLRPFDWGSFLKDATQIISQLAVSAASLAVLRNN